MGKFRDIIKHSMAFKGLQQWPSAPAVWEPPYVEMVNGQKVLKSQRKWRTKRYWLVVWNIFHLSIYWECHHPNWLIFFRGVGQPGQPPTSIFHSHKGVALCRKLCLKPCSLSTGLPGPEARVAAIRIRVWPPWAGISRISDVWSPGLRIFLHVYGKYQSVCA